MIINNLTTQMENIQITKPKKKQSKEFIGNIEMNIRIGQRGITGYSAEFIS